MSAVVCSACGVGLGEYHRPDCAILWGGKTADPDVIAQRRLHAAAPAMLEALKEIVSATHDEKGWLARHVNAIAFAAKAKATGADSKALSGDTV